MKEEVTLGMIYAKLQNIEKILDRIEQMLMSCEQLPQEEFEDDKTNLKHAIKEHKEGKTVSLEDI